MSIRVRALPSGLNSGPEGIATFVWPAQRRKLVRSSVRIERLPLRIWAAARGVSSVG